MHHAPVMPREILAHLNPRPGQVYADATAGLGGHASLIAPHLLPGGTVLLCDLDPGNLAHASRAVADAAPGIRILEVNANFALLPHELRARSLRADLLLADLGVASVHLDHAERGFSFMRDGPLDMRLNPQSPLTAAELVQSLPESELARIIADYGEERAARAVARKLVQERARGPISTTARLAAVVRSVVRPAPGGVDPATRTFQALRIAVNDEIGSLEALLAAAVADASPVARSRDGGWLSPGAVLAFISFHSLEDRPVKRAFAQLISQGAQDLTRGHTSALPDEVSDNPRARSAKLRAVRLPDRSTTENHDI
jgi:16S rRNA (cytosine1402-N4)-methyltransferase